MNCFFRTLLNAPLRFRARFHAPRRTTRREPSRFFYKANIEVLETRLALAGLEFRQFDFNTAASPNQAGWTSVKKGDLFNQTSGYGWEIAASSDTYDSRASGDDVIKDGHIGKSGKFGILVNPGSSYDLELIFRDKRPREFKVSLEANPGTIIKLPKMTVVSQQFSNVISADNILTIQFDAPLSREEFIINGLKISGEPVVRNTPPVANDDAAVLDEDSSSTIDVLANDSDINGDPLTISSLTQPANGKISNDAGYLTYTPKADFFGNDPFTYTISDGKGGTSSANVTVVVNGINDPPTARDDSGSGFQTQLDTGFVTANVLSNDTDPDGGDALQLVAIDTTMTVGSVTANGDGTLNYVPPQGYVGNDLFRYTVSDSSGATASASVTISIRNKVTSGGIWISVDEVMALPTSGLAWETLLSAANSTANTPDIKNQDDNTDVLTLAKALVGVRLGNEQLLSQARANILAAIGTETGGRTLALGRNLASYVIAAELAGLPPQDDEIFRAWLRTALTENLSGRTLQSTHEDRPNNWGTMAGGSRAAVAVYLGDAAELERTATVFKGYLGDRGAYAEFNYGSDLSWQADPNLPVGINPKGAMKEGHSIDGVLPDDMRRGGSFTWPPSRTGYPWEGLQGALVQAEILHRAGYDAWQWQDQALLRAVEFLYGLGWAAEGDDLWQPWLINARYGSSFAADPAARHGKIIGWTAWTHQPTATRSNSLTIGSVASTEQALVTSLQTATSLSSNEQVFTSAEGTGHSPSIRDVAVSPLINPIPPPAKCLSVPSNSKSIGGHKLHPGKPEADLLSSTFSDDIFAHWPRLGL